MTAETSKVPIRVETVLGQLTWQSDQIGFAVTFPGRTARGQWDEIMAAGLVESAMPMARAGVPAPVLGEMGKYLPGLGQLTRINEHLAENYRTLVLTRGPDQARAIRIPLPLDNHEAAELAQEVHQRLAIRWMGDIAIGDSYRRLGLRQPWWTIPFSILFFCRTGLDRKLNLPRHDGDLRELVQPAPASVDCHGGVVHPGRQHHILVPPALVALGASQ